MKYLADTHILLWAMENDLEQSRLPTKAKQILMDADAEIFYSFANVWEVALKRARHPEKIPYSAQQFEQLCRASGFLPLATEFRHAVEMETLHYMTGTPRRRITATRLTACCWRRQSAKTCSLSLMTI